MKRKYELIDDKMPPRKGLKRIKALRSFGGVTKGEIGGYVESDANLSHDGLCWVADAAMVYGMAEVLDDAQVFGQARVYDTAKVAGNAVICDHAKIHQSASVFDHAYILNGADVFGTAKVRGRSHVADRAKVFDYAVVGDSASIRGNAIVRGAARILGRSFVGGKANVHGFIRDEASVIDDAFVCSTGEVFGSARLSSGVLGGRVLTGYAARWAIAVSGPTTVTVGCQTHPIKDWLDPKSKKIPWDQHNVTAAEKAEIRGWIRLFATQAKINERFWHETA